MITIQATVPFLSPATWAVLERKLIDVMEQAIHFFLQKYTRPDGTLIWREESVWRGHDGTGASRDGADDFYESFYNWPLLYLLGGSSSLLSLSLRQWEVTTQQLVRLGLVDAEKEYDIGSDQFHQGEGCLFFYFLCMADPTNPRLEGLARRFAGFYLNEEPEAQNYDPQLRIIRAPHTGSRGPRWGWIDGEPTYGWHTDMRQYGLPYTDIPGISSYEDLKDDILAKRMGQAMHARMGRVMSPQT